MSYNPQEWRNFRAGRTPISAARFTHMEEGIKEASDRLDEVAVDSRWADTRTPKTHAASHASGGSDPVTPAAIGALDQAAGDARYPRKSELVYNVKDFGATGNGVTDDRAAIQAAIDRAGQGGGTVLFPAGAGTYNITAALRVPNAVTLRGGTRSTWSMSGAQAKIALANGIDSPAIVNADQVNGNDAITIESLYIVGSSVGTSSAIDIRGTGAAPTQSVFIRDCTIARSGGHSINFVSVQEGEVRSCFLLGAGRSALCLDGSYDNTISSNQITVQQPAPVGAHGIEIINSSPHNIIRGNFVFLCDWGIVFSNAPRNIIDGNRINTNARDGIYHVAGPNSAYTVISNNVLLDNGTGLTGTRAGIMLDGSTALLSIIGNTCSDSRTSNKTQMYGIRVDADSTQNLVTGNMCGGNGLTPGLTVGSTKPNQVYGNQIDGSVNIDLYGYTGFGGGVKVLGIPDATTEPTTNPVGGGVLYSKDGSLKWRGSDGAINIGEYALNVQNYGAKGNGTADDTAALQAALTAGAGVIVRGHPGHTYLISAPLVVSSGTTLDMTGCTIRLKAGSNCNMLQNAQVVANNGRDSNITVLGGLWDRGANGGTGTGNHSLVFRRVDRIAITDLKVTSSGGKYAINLGDVVDYRVERIHFAVSSDGVHVNGPAYNGTISNIKGSTGDDAVAFTATDYGQYNDVSGPIVSASVDDVQVVNSTYCLKITAGAGTYCQDISARTVHQRGSGGAVFFAADTGPVDARGISIEDVVGSIASSGGTITDLSIRDARFTPTINNAVWFGLGDTTIGSLSVRGLRSDSAYTSNHGISLAGAANIKDLTIDDAHWRGANCYLVVFQGAQTVTWFKGSNLYRDGINDSGGIVQAAGGGVLSYVELVNVTQERDAWVADLKPALTLSLSNVRSRGGINLRDGASIIVRGSGIDVGGSATTGQVTFRSRSDLPVDVSKLIGSVAGDTAYNTNASVAGGVGPVVYNGTTWARLTDKVDTTDARLSNARTPTAHKASHATGGADALSPADIGALDQATADGRYVNVSGDTMTGALTFPSLSDLRTNIPANKFYVPDPLYPTMAPFASMWHDLMAFNRHLGVPRYETSADGVAFTTATLEPKLFSLKESQNIPVLNGTTTKAVRWTWDGSQVAWCGASWLVIGHAYVATAATKTVKVESSSDNVVWTTRHTSTGDWNQTPVWYSVTGWGGDTQFRVTITWSSGGAIALTSMRLLTTRWGSQGGGREIEFPYDWDETRRMQHPDPVNPADTANKAYADTKAPARPNPAAGRYLFTASPQGAATNNTLANSMLRLVPWLVDEAMTIDRIGADIAAVGEAGSKLRLGIYADNGSAYPGSLVVDAGQVAGDSATVQELTIASVTLQPGLYWVGGAVQNAATTQPTVRVVSSWTPPIQMATGTTLPVANQAQIGYSQGSVAGALPPSFTTSLSMVSSAPRLFVRTA